MYVTTYSRSLRRRKGPKAGTTETIHCYYETQTLTGMHAILRKRYPGATTIGGYTAIYTDLIPGLSLDQVLVVGGTKITD